MRQNIFLMNILWLDLNCSYSHSSLALPCIHAQLEEEKDNWDVLRTTTNVNTATIVRDIISRKPDIIMATAWLFTHEKLHAVICRLKQILPEVTIALGGPEFLGNNEEYLRKNDHVDIIFRGEGEESVLRWLEIHKDKNLWKNIEGVCFLNDLSEYIDNGYARIREFDKLKSPEESRFFCNDRAFVQFETARGCFNTCAFCVSGEDKPVRNLSLDNIRQRLDTYLSMGIKSIRLLDRTFNGQSRRASQMLDIFNEYNGRLDFHLEVHPAMLSEEVREKLKVMPAGLLHLEAGIQSLHQNVLTLSQRLGTLEASLDGLKYLCSLDNIITHTDLISGLPGYTYDMLYQDVYKLSQIRASEIQLETLKVLPGTKMRREADKLGLKYSPLPPYEILQTEAMSMDDLHRSVKLSRVIDFYYNTEAWQELFQNIMDKEPSFLNDLIDFLSDEILEMPLSMEKRGLLLLDFCNGKYPQYIDDISFYWILGGLSTSKDPAKDLKAYILDVRDNNKESAYVKDINENFDIISGYTTPLMRYYTFRDYIFGFDRAVQRQKPVFVGKRKKLIL